MRCRRFIGIIEMIGEKKTAILRIGFRLHALLATVGAIALLVFALSGMTHPLMSWTGPRAAAFFPPRAQITGDHLSHIPTTLSKAAITSAVLVKVVPSESTPLLQVTEDSTQPRRYFELSSGNELLDHDQQQAVWLARYYAGHQETKVRAVTFHRSFSDEYPWVNRLLPVYKVEFETADNLTLFVYTELSALGDIINDWKRSLQRIFRWGHTFSFLEDAEIARIILVGLLIASLLGMTISGLIMVSLMKSRTMPLRRKIHRTLGFAIWLPLLMLSVSGLYHLMQSSLDNRRGALQLPPPFSLSAERFGSDSLPPPHLETASVTSINLLEAPDGELVYRLGIPNGESSEPVSRQMRFAGTPLEKAPLYLSARSGEPLPLADKEIAHQYATHHLGPSSSHIISAELVTQFSPDYDFRNKRLPVWRLEYGAPTKETIFVDPASGLLVERVTPAQQLEGLSFSQLHKGNFLVPLLGRGGRDLLVVGVLIASIIATILGLQMKRSASRVSRKS